MPESKEPKSPDVLQPAIHGKVGGVTRIGRKAIAAGALVGGLLLVLILYGAQHSGSKTVTVAALPSAPAPEISANASSHFGADVPLAVPTEIPTATPAAPIVLPAGSATAVVAPPPTPEPAPSLAPAVEPPAPTSAVAAAAAASAERAAAERAASQASQAQARQARRDALDAARQARDAVNASAARAPIVLAASEGASPVAVTTTSAAGAPPPTGTGSAPPNAFLNGPTGQLANGAALKPIVSDRIAPASPYEVVAGSVIPAILVTAINSQNAGLITGQVREDVYDSMTGRYLLIPRGSKLLGVYKNEVALGQSRLLVAWKRLIFPDTSSIDLVNMSGADVEGSAGFEGRVDTHFGKLLSQALLGSIITAGLQLSQPPQQNTSSTTTTGGTTTVSTGQVAAASIGQSIAQVVTNQLQNQAMVPPTVYIPRGYPFVVIVDRDLVLNTPYRS